MVVIETEILAVGDRLVSAIRDVIAPFKDRAPGPQALARTLGLDKVLTSRVLKATRARDAIAAAHAMPGPEPLRRLVRAAAKRGAAAAAVTQASAAIGEFEVLIRDRIGDRSLLDAIVSAWVPEARREFELRRKQAAFKAISQLKGAQAQAIVATVVLSPSVDGRHVDVTWVNGLIGLQRLRPGVRVKLTTRRLSAGDGERHPMSLGGTPVEDHEHLLLREFCSDPPPRVRVQRAGEVVHYVLDDAGFGPDSAGDLVFGEVNRPELPRYLPAGSTRLSYFFAEVVTCAKVLQFDALVHEDLYPGSDPALRIYDTSFEGAANVNDRARDLDQLDLSEAIEPLGLGPARWRSLDVPRYAEMIRHAFDAMDLDAARFRGHRCRIDYPVYGSQVTMALKPQTEG